MPLPYTVGLTGGIGSGKSVVARLFAVLGVPVTDADTRAKWLMANDPALRTALVEAFGPAVFDAATGHLDRAGLARRAFADATVLTRLNALVHPAVGHDFATWLTRQGAAGAPYIVKEAAILFEADIARSLDFVVTVAAPKALRVRRVLVRDPHRTETDVRAILARQWTEAQRQTAADWVLHNDDVQPLLPQVLALDAELRRRANSRPL